MTKLDANKLVTMATVIVIITLAAVFGYRLELGLGGLIFEKNPAEAPASN